MVSGRRGHGHAAFRNVLQAPAGHRDTRALEIGRSSGCSIRPGILIKETGREIGRLVGGPVRSGRHLSIQLLDGVLRGHKTPVAIRDSGEGRCR
jgi:hypothetical protein